VRLQSRWPKLRVAVVGDGWWADELHARTQELGLEDVVDFCGYVDEQRKHEELAKAWLLAAPSIKEGWGLVVMEAATHEVPTVGYQNAGGLAESVIHDETGLLVEGFDAFVEAIATLLDNTTTRRRLGSIAAVHAQVFQWDAAITAWEVLLSEVVRPESHPDDRRTVANSADADDQLVVP
jgi:glycosyltransferase involved in cell wall biosynthesis